MTARITIDLGAKGPVLRINQAQILLEAHSSPDVRNAPIGATNWTRRKGEKPMYFNHREFIEEQEEQVEHEEPWDLEAILELEGILILEREPIVEPTREYVPMDDYLEKELEREKQEKLAEILPDRIP